MFTYIQVFTCIYSYLYFLKILKNFLKLGFYPVLLTFYAFFIFVYMQIYFFLRLNKAFIHSSIQTLYLHYQSAYDHQTWYDGNLPWWAGAYKVTSPFD